MSLTIEPVPPDRWDDLVALFGPRGAVAGCWCMWWRLSAKEWESKAYEGNRRSMKKLVDADEQPGLLAYRDGVPVGWVSVAPREQFPRIERSRVLGPVDDAEVWSIVCFFIHRKERASGIGSVLLDAAVDAAAKRGARIVEGYPVDPRGKKTSNGSAFTGVEAMFRAAGFEEVKRRSAGRPIMRKTVKRGRKTSSRSAR